MIAFYRESERGDYEQLLKQYAYHSDRFDYRFVDPDKEPVEAMQYAVTRYGITVIEYGDKEEIIVVKAYEKC